MNKQVNRILIFILAALSIGAVYMEWVHNPVPTIRLFGMTATGGRYNVFGFLSELITLNKDVLYVAFIIVAYMLSAAVTGIRAIFGMRLSRWGLVTSIVMFVAILCFINEKSSLNDIGRDMELSGGYYLTWMCAIGFFILSVVGTAKPAPTGVPLSEAQPAPVSGSVNQIPPATPEEPETPDTSRSGEPEQRILIKPPPTTTAPREQDVTAEPAPATPAGKKSQPMILWVGIAMLLFAAGAAVYYMLIEP